MDAPLGQLEPKCHFKVQCLNNHFFSFSVKFLTIMRRSSRKCPVVTHHKKLIATFSKKGRACEGAGYILNGVLKGPTTKLTAGAKLPPPGTFVAHLQILCPTVAVKPGEPHSPTKKAQSEQVTT